MAQFERDFRRLCRQIDSLSNGQIRVNQENIFINSTCAAHASHSQLFYIEFSPRDGLYAHASFLFCIWPQTQFDYISHEQYPTLAPMISCLTPIYHPNINNRLVCLSIINEWNGQIHKLDDLVQGLMFLFYEPNLESALFCVPLDNQIFHSNIRTSIEGGQVKLDHLNVHHFEINYGYKRYLFDKNQKSNQSIHQNNSKNRNNYSMINSWYHMLKGFRCLYEFCTNFVIYIFRFISIC